eukprot:jgi/Mesvir1/7859/Mv11793-RA.1
MARKGINRAAERAALEEYFYMKRWLEETTRWFIAVGLRRRVSLSDARARFESEAARIWARVGVRDWPGHVQDIMAGILARSAVRAPSLGAAHRAGVRQETRDPVMDTADGTRVNSLGGADAVDRAWAERTYADYLSFRREEDEFWVFSVKPQDDMEVDASKDVRVRKSDGRVQLKAFTRAMSNGKKDVTDWTRSSLADEWRCHLEFVKTSDNDKRGTWSDRAPLPELISGRQARAHRVRGYGARGALESMAETLARFIADPSVHPDSKAGLQEQLNDVLLQMEGMPAEEEELFFPEHADEVVERLTREGDCGFFFSPIAKMTRTARGGQRAKAGGCSRSGGRCSALTKHGVRCSKVTQGRRNKCSVHSNKGQRVTRRVRGHRMRAGDKYEWMTLEEQDEWEKKIDELLERGGAEDFLWLESQPRTRDTPAELERRIVARENAERIMFPAPFSPYLPVNPYKKPAPAQGREQFQSVGFVEDLERQRAEAQRSRALAKERAEKRERMLAEDAAAWAQIQASRGAPGPSRALAPAPGPAPARRVEPPSKGFFGRLFGRK